MPSSPDRDYIEQALTAAAERGLIQSWEPHSRPGPGANKWLVTLNPGVDIPGWADTTIYRDRELAHVVIRTHQEGKLFCMALASAGQVTALPAQAKVALQAAFSKALNDFSGPGSTHNTHNAFYTLGVAVAELVDVSFDSYVSTTDREEDEETEIGYPSVHLAQILADLGLTGVTAGPYGSFPVVITGIFPEGGDAGLHVFRVAESLADGRAHSTTQGRMSEPLWAGIFEPNAVGWVTSPIEAWDGLTVQQVRDKITGYL